MLSEGPFKRGIEDFTGSGEGSKDVIGKILAEGEENHQAMLRDLRKKAKAEAESERHQANWEADKARGAKMTIADIIKDAQYRRKKKDKN